METSTHITFARTQRTGFLSVIIPVYKDAKGLRDTLASLRKQTLPASDYEVIVANDGADTTVQEACTAFDAKCVDLATNRGSYAARNRALAESSGEYIAFVDADISVPRDWLYMGRTLLEDYDYVGGAVRFNPGELTRASHYYEAGVAFNNAYRFKRHHYAPTANLFIRRTVVEDIGGFDSRFRSGGDAEFGNRAYLARRSMTFSDDLYVYHPPRGYRALVRKVKRTTLGMRDKLQFYPDRFAYLTMSPLRALLIPLMPAWKLLREGQLNILRTFLTLPLAFWFGLVEYYYFVCVFYIGTTE